MKRMIAARLVAGATLMACAAHADVKVANAWVRATVPAQKSTGAFMTLTSSEDAKVVSVATPAAKRIEMHLTSHEQGVMHMRAVEAIELPAGKAVALQPGGYHLMLLGLAKPVSAGEQLPLTLTIADKQGKRTTLEVRAEVRPIASR